MSYKLPLSLIHGFANPFNPSTFVVTTFTSSVVILFHFFFQFTWTEFSFRWVSFVQLSFIANFDLNFMSFYYSKSKFNHKILSVFQWNLFGFFMWDLRNIIFQRISLITEKKRLILVKKEKSYVTEWKYEY